MGAVYLQAIKGHVILPTSGSGTSISGVRTVASNVKIIVLAALHLTLEFIS